MNPYQRQWRSVQSIAATVLFLFVVNPSLFSQVTVFPLDYQLYPRDLVTNKATINVSGDMDITTGYTQVRLKRYRNGSLQKTTNITLVYDLLTGKAHYDIINEITAELATYKFNFYGVKGKTETLIKTVNNVVAGDAYIIQGQSNAVANLRGVFSTANNADDPSNSPNRNYVRVYGNGSATSTYTHGWFIGRGNSYYDTDGQTGQWGMRMGSNLAGAKGIPIAIFNGASPGQHISYFSRNDALPTDPATNYGRLLNRITEAGFKNNIRGVIWHQGESDILGSLSPTQLTTEQYKAAFTDLMNDWKADYPGLAKFVLFQIRYGCGMSNADNCLKIQEAQRQLDKESAEIVTIGTGNTSQLFDGGTINYCHYNLYDGYKNMGDWASNILRREVYAETGLPASIESPEPESASFTSLDANGVASQVNLVLKDQATTLTLAGDLSSLFRLDGGSYTVSSVTLSGRNLLINFTRNSGTSTNPTTISYRGHDQVAAPNVTNGSGLALINFDKFTITQVAPPPPPPPPACADLFEPNNSIMETKSINANTTYTATIGSATDEDWYRFRTWAPWRYVKVSIWGMAADYDLYLYDVNGVLLASSTVSGNTAEAVIYNNGPDDFNYRLKVVSKSGGFNADVCYSIRLQASSGAWPLNSPPYASTKNKSIGAPMEEVARVEVPLAGTEISTYPNPVLQTMRINYPTAKAGDLELRVVDMTGRQVLVKRVTAISGQNQFQLNVNGLTPGSYMLQMRRDGELTTRKFLVGSK